MATMVLEVTVAQAAELEGKQYDGKGYFNVVTDADGKLFISKEEQAACDHILNPDLHLWIHDLPELIHNPVIVEL
jgi:hypothetical protein